jgi:hypothetical protein
MTQHEDAGERRGRVDPFRPDRRMKPRLPFTLPGRHLRLDVGFDGKTASVFRVRVVDGPLIRSPRVGGSLVYQVVAAGEVLWVDTLPYEGMEYGIARPGEVEHHVGPTAAALLPVRVPLRADAILPGLEVRLFAARKALPPDTADLDAMLDVPDRLPAELEPVASITARDVAKAPGAADRLAAAGIRFASPESPEGRPEQQRDR